MDVGGTPDLEIYVGGDLAYCSNIATIANLDKIGKTLA